MMTQHPTTAYRATRGFTLVETLIAITIVTAALVGPLYAVQQSLNTARIARNQIVATALAQEALEYIRTIRDSNYLYALEHPGSGRTWLYDLNACVNADCEIDPLSYSAPSGSTNQPLRLDTRNTYRQTNTGTVTPFTRKARISGVAGSTTEVVLTVTVSWVDKGTPYSVVITENLHNWL